MTFQFNKLVLRFFSLLLVATAIGITYPGQKVSAGPLETCVLNCGSIHQSIEQCYQQAACARTCRSAQCDIEYSVEYAACIPDNGPISEPCVALAQLRRTACKASANNKFRSAKSLCDRLYWEHCPSPE